MGNWTLYFLFLIPPLILGFVVQHWLKKTVAANMQVAVASGLTGADVARQILDRNGLQDVPVEMSPGGPLSDHYDPRKKSVHLSEPVYGGRSVASTAIAAHEVGHAIQHAKAYGPFRLRSAMWPAVAFASNAWFILLLIGVFSQLFGLVTFAVISLRRRRPLPDRHPARGVRRLAAGDGPAERHRASSRAASRREPARCSPPPR